MNLSSVFPRLTSANHRVTSAADLSYNCFAWAINLTDRWIAPAPPFAYWPAGIPPSLTLNNLTAVYTEYGYERCDSPALEPGYEKIAIYADRRGIPTHAARQLDTGRWTSKLGELEDIEHDDLEVLDGRAYGAAVRYMRRLVAPRVTS